MNPFLLKQLSVRTPEEDELLRNGHLELERYGLQTDDRIDCTRLLKSGNLIQIRPHTRFVHFPPHRHNYIEMVYMCAGRTCHRINGTEIRLEAGELLLLDQTACQEIEPAGEADIAVNFLILPEFFGRAFEILGGEENPVVDFLNGCLFDGKASVGYLHFQVADVIPVQNLIENLVWTLLYDEPNTRRIRQETMGLLLAVLANHLDRLNVVGNGPHALKSDVLLYIEENYATASLTELSRRLCLSLGALSKRIHRTFGVSFQSLVQQYRLQKASYLLSNTVIPVHEIIASLGYENSAYFYRMFRQRYGLSPLQYRKAAAGVSNQVVKPDQNSPFFDGKKEV